MVLVFAINFLCVGFLVPVVIGQPPRRTQDEWYKEQWPSQPYSFGYEIRDTYGNEQYRKEVSDGDRVTGSYGYLGPDGIFRHVEYTADENGFRARIRTTEPGTANENAADVTIDANPVVIPQNPPQGESYSTPRNPANIPRDRNIDNVYRSGDARPLAGDPRPIPDDRPYSSRPSRPAIANIPSVGQRDGPQRNPAIVGNPNPGPNIGRNDGVARNRETNFENVVQPYYGNRVGANRPVSRDFVAERAPQSNFDSRNYAFRGTPNKPNNFAQLPPPPPPPLPPPPPPPTVPPQVFPSPLLLPPIDNQNYDPDYRGDDRNIQHNIPNRNYEYGDNQDSTVSSIIGVPVPNTGIGSKFDGKIDNIGNPARFDSTSGFIEANKDSPRGNNLRDIYNKGLFDDDRDNYDEFKRRRDDDPNHDKPRRVTPISKPVFEDRDSPQRELIITNNRYDNNERQPLVKAREQSYRDSALYNKSLVDQNQGQLNIDDRERKPKRPTKVFVTNGPIFTGDEKKSRPAVKGVIHDRDDKRKFEDRFMKEVFEKNRGVKDRPDIKRVERPPPTEARPVQPYHDRRYSGQPYQGERTQKPFQEPTPSLRPVPPINVYTPQPPPTNRPQIGQRPVQDVSRDDPIQQVEEYPVDQPLRPVPPIVLRPLRPSRPPVRQPTQPEYPMQYPRRDQIDYKLAEPRQPFPDVRPYVEQQRIDGRSYQPESLVEYDSGTLRTPTNTVSTIYKPELNKDDGNKHLLNKQLTTPTVSTPYANDISRLNPKLGDTNKKTLNLESHIDINTPSSVETVRQIPKFGARVQSEPPTKPSYHLSAEVVSDLKDNHDNSDNTDDYYVEYDDDHQNETQADETSSQLTSESNNESSALISTSSPIDFLLNNSRAINVMDWRKYDHIDDHHW